MSPQRSCVILTCLFVLAAPAAAQAPAPAGTVTGQGKAEVQRQPELLRVQVEILVKARDLPTALARLKERRDAAGIHLKSMAALPDSIAFAAPSLAPEKTEQQKQMEQMVMQRMRGSGKPVPKKKETPPVVLSSTLTFDVPLKASDAAELLLAAHALQERVKEADLGGKKEFEKLTPEEEELAEEARAMSGGYQQQGPQRGEPSFLFVARLTDPDVDRALSEAYQQARRHAEQLARAAGARLGRLHHLDDQVNTANGQGLDPQTAYYYRYGYAPGAGMPQPPRSRASEATAPQAGPVTHHVALAATFVLQSAKE
jgi:hypothetical protein